MGPVHRLDPAALADADRLLDELGARRTPAEASHDPLVAALAAWVQDLDDAGSGCPATRRQGEGLAPVIALPVRPGRGRHRVSRRLVGGTVLTGFVLAGSSVAAAITGTHVPVLSAVGTVLVDIVEGPVGEGPKAPVTAPGVLPPAVPYLAPAPVGEAPSGLSPGDGAAQGTRPASADPEVRPTRPDPSAPPVGARVSSTVPPVTTHPATTWQGTVAPEASVPGWLVAPGWSTTPHPPSASVDPPEHAGLPGPPPHAGGTGVPGHADDASASGSAGARSESRQEPESPSTRRPTTTAPGQDQARLTAAPGQTRSSTASERSDGTSSLLGKPGAPGAGQGRPQQVGGPATSPAPVDPSARPEQAGGPTTSPAPVDPSARPEQVGGPATSPAPVDPSARPEQVGGPTPTPAPLAPAS